MKKLFILLLMMSCSQKSLSATKAIKKSEAQKIFQAYDQKSVGCGNIDSEVTDLGDSWQTFGYFGFTGEKKALTIHKESGQFSIAGKVEEQNSRNLLK